MASLAREICVHVPLHASTMMNVHNAETALALKMMGFARIIPSRDIPLHEIRRIGERSGLEMECFVHGDMCISQSSQCYLSGILFGESANCGRCMKPCRWQWKLVPPQGDGESAAAEPGLPAGPQGPVPAAAHPRPGPERDRLPEDRGPDADRRSSWPRSWRCIARRSTPISTIPPATPRTQATCSGSSPSGSAR